MSQRKRIGEILVAACVVSQQQLEDALQRQKKKTRLLGQILVEAGWASEQDVCRAVSESLRVDYVNIAEASGNQEVMQLVPESLLAKFNILPLFIRKKTLHLAMENPLNIDLIQRIEFNTGMQVKPIIAPPSQLRKAIRKYYNIDEHVGELFETLVQEEPLSIEQQTEQSDYAMNIGAIRKISEDCQIVRIVNRIVIEGIKKRASDIHIEPALKHVNVRYRIDGMLTKRVSLSKAFQLPLISRMKVLAGMDIAERRKPQDGRIKVFFAQREIDLRVSTLRTNFGEKVVIRILDKKVAFRDLNHLGFSAKHLE